MESGEVEEYSSSEGGGEESTSPSATFFDMLSSLSRPLIVVVFGVRHDGLDGSSMSIYVDAARSQRGCQKYFSHLPKQSGTTFLHFFVCGALGYLASQITS